MKNIFLTLAFMLMASISIAQDYAAGWWAMKKENQTHFMHILKADATQEYHVFIQCMPQLTYNHAGMGNPGETSLFCATYDARIKGTGLESTHFIATADRLEITMPAMYKPADYKPMAVFRRATPAEIAQLYIDPFGILMQKGIPCPDHKKEQNDEKDPYDANTR